MYYVLHLSRPLHVLSIRPYKALKIPEYQKVHLFIYFLALASAESLKKEIVSRRYCCMKLWLPQDQVFWYLNRASTPTCRDNIVTDIAIIGGGMAGLSAAQAFATKGKKVVLLEQY